MATLKGFNNSLIFFFLVLTLGAVARAHIAEFDEYWRNRSMLAQQASLQVYHPSPEDITTSFNSNVSRALLEGSGTKSTRRSLSKYDGPCIATNPIDRCWRCQPNWEANRKRLADCVMGFGRNTTGGKAGRIYVVTDPSDDDMMNPKPGTLRYAVIQPEPLWIIFDRSMNIRLAQELIMTSDKTIDARGAFVHIVNGAGITLQYVNNIIIHGLRIHNIYSGSGGMIRDSVNHFGLRTTSDGDGISLYGASNIWIDHVSMRRCYDGLIDVIMGSTGITISNSHFTSHNEVMLFGSSGSYSGDSIMQITLAFNHFGQGLVQRMPRVRWGYIHVVNNDYTHWLMYAIGGSQNPTIISQGNRFIAPPDVRAKEVTKREYAMESEWKNWVWRSENDVMMNGAFFTESGSSFDSNKFIKKRDLVPARHGKFASSLTRMAGSLNCWVNQPC